MKNIILILFSSPLFCMGQIWNYPPEPISNWQYNQGLKKDSVKQIKVWNHIIVDSMLTGEKELTLTQDLDRHQNTTQLIYKHGTRITFDKYNDEFWGLKIIDDKSYVQSIELDSHNNVTKLIINSFENTFTYDTLNRPVKSTASNSYLRLWYYKNNKINLYQEFQDSILKEERKYYYDSILNTIAYSTYYFDTDETAFNSNDSVVATLNKNGIIIEINDFEINNNVAELIYTFNYDSNGKLIMSGFKGKCSSKHYEKQNKKGYTLYFERRDCDGNILSKTSYEYKFY